MWYRGLDDLLCTIGQDQGDACQREGYLVAIFRFTMQYVDSNYQLPANHPGLEKVFSGIIDEQGQWRRAKDETKWYSNPATFTRDQINQWNNVLSKIGRKHLLKSFLWQLVKHFNFFPNWEKGWNDGPKYWWKGEFPDFAGPEFWANSFRELGWWWTWPLLCILDIGHVINSCLKAGWVPELNEGAGWIWGDPNWGTDDSNHVVAICQAHFIYKTPTSWLANYIYWNKRKVNNGNTILGEKHPVMGALAWYFRDDWGSQPELIEYSRPLVNYMVKQYGK